MFQLTGVPVLSEVVVTFLSSFVVLTANGQVLDCATLASSDRYVKVTENRFYADSPCFCGKDWRDVANVSTQDLRSGSRNVVRRCEACFEVGGRQCKYLLWSKVSWNEEGKRTLYSRRTQASYSVRLPWYVGGSISFRPDIQRPRQMQNALRDI